MPLYEHIFLTRPDISEQANSSLCDHFKDLLEQKGGKVVAVENWGLKQLAYPINKVRKARYNLINIDAPSQAVKDMEAKMRIHNDILRFLTLKVEEHSSLALESSFQDRPRRANSSFGSNAG